MEQNLVASIRKTMEKKSTEKLKKMYIEHNEFWLSPEAFAAIYQILTDRREAVTPYDPDYEKVTPNLLLPSTLQLPSPSGKIVGGIIWTLLGLFIYLWASGHSPYNPLGAMMTGGLENYVLKKPFYTVILLVAAGLGLLGISLLVLGLIDRAKTGASSPQNIHDATSSTGQRFCSECGKLNRVQSRFCGYCGSSF